MAFVRGVQLQEETSKRRFKSINEETAILIVLQDILKSSYCIKIEKLKSLPFSFVIRVRANSDTAVL